MGGGIAVLCLPGGDDPPGPPACHPLGPAKAGRRDWPGFAGGVPVSRRRSAGDRDQAAVGEGRISLLGVAVPPLDAAPALLVAPAAAREVVHGVTAVEVRHV